MPSTFQDMKRDIEEGWDEVIWSESYGPGDFAALAACVYFGCAAQYLSARLETLKQRVGEQFLEQVMRNKGKVLFGPGELEVQGGDAYWSVYHRIWNPLKQRHEKVTTERYIRLYIRYRRRTNIQPPITDNGFVLQTGTGLHEIGDEWQVALAPNNDLFAIKTRGGGTDSTEVHVLSAASNYQDFALHTGTGLHETGDEWEFLVAPNRDLLAIRKRATGTNSTEVHVLSAQSNYQDFILHTGTGLHETGTDWQFAVASNRDLFAIKKQGTGTNSTEVHVLSAASNYQDFALHTGTALHPADEGWEFAVASNRDIFAIKKQATGTMSTEVHVLGAASNYQNFSLQTGTVLHPTQENWNFEVTGNRDLFGIKKQATGTGKTEVHVVNLP